MASANSCNLNPEADPYSPLIKPLLPSFSRDIYDVQFQPLLGFPYYVFSQLPLYAPFGCYDQNSFDVVDLSGFKGYEKRSKSAICPPRLKSWKKNDVQRSENGQTTVMIKNIPNHYNRKKLLQILDWHCLEENEKAKVRHDPLKSEYDFVYLPMDFWYNANLGYAFVNFTNSAGASRFLMSFHNKKWYGHGQKKICEISWAKYQGKEKLVAHFKNSMFTCHTDCYMPVVFSPPRNGTMSSPSKLITVGKRADYLYRKPLKRSY